MSSVVVVINQLGDYQAAFRNIFLFAREIEFDWSELSPVQTIHMKCQVLFSKKSKKELFYKYVVCQLFDEALKLIMVLLPNMLMLFLILPLAYEVRHGLIMSSSFHSCVCPAGPYECAFAS